MDNPYRTDIMTPEEEVAYLRRLLACAEARLRLASGSHERAPFTSDTSEVSDLLVDWRSFYRQLFDLNLDFSTLQIPKKQEGFSRLLVMAEGMTPNRFYTKCAELFSCWKYMDNLDAITSDRDPTKQGSYAIWVRDRVEADEELKNKSANMLEEDGVKGITLPERLAFELKYFKETGKHLDVKNITLCSGSRYPGGGVPSVHWGAGNGRMNVDWYAPVDWRGTLRARAAVTL